MTRGQCEVLRLKGVTSSFVGGGCWYNGSTRRSPAQRRSAAYRAAVCRRVLPIALAPGATADYSRAVKLAETALATGGGEMRAGHLNTQGAVLYRAGRHREAVARLQEAITLTGEGGVEDRIFLGLARHALGEMKEARRWLDKIRAASQPSGNGFSWGQRRARSRASNSEPRLPSPSRIKTSFAAD